jgi:hypothetical protein
MSKIKENSLVEIAREFYTAQEMADILFCDVAGLRRKIKLEGIVFCKVRDKHKAQLYSWYQFQYLKGEL